MMKNLTAADLRSALDNLFTDPARFSIFKSTAAFTVYGAELDSIRVELPLTLKGGRAKVRELDNADAYHDDLGSALWLFAEAIKKHPLASAALKEKATRIQSEFIPTLAAVAAKYKKEAQSAKANRPKLDGMKADLESIPTPDGRTAYAWVVDFLDSGDRVGVLLEDRSRIEADEPGPELIRARTRGVSLVTRARALVAEETEKNTSLPRNAEAFIFGYFDTLTAFRSNAKSDDEPPPLATPTELPV